jgi:hypothetical protein
MVAESSSLEKTSENAQKLKKSSNYIRQQLAGCLHVIETVCRLYGFKGVTNTKKTLEHWQLASKEIGWMKLVKYKLNAFFCWYNQDEDNQPVKPFDVKDKGSDLVGGRMGRWVKRMLNPRTKWSDERKDSFLNTMLQSKSGMPRPSDEEIEEQVVKTKELLSSRDDRKITYESLIPWGDVGDYPKLLDFTSTELSEESIRFQCRRTVNELISKDEQFGMDDIYEPFFPSTSANYIYSRSNLGSVGWLLQNKMFVKWLRRRGGYLKNIVKKQYEEEQRESIKEVNSWDPKEQNVFKHAFADLMAYTLEAAKKETNEVKFVGLGEALKVRTITKEPPARSFYLKALQRKIWKILYRYKVFKLIGHPTTPEIVQDGLGKHLKKDQSFLNGDYSQATNLLKSFVSKEIALAISERLDLPDDERDLFVDSLINHEFKMANGETVTQKRGQFMGSITSFNVLCIANLALSRWSLEIAEKRSIRINDVNMLINGDDVVIKGPDNLFPIWKKITSAGGLVTSVGKTFVSKVFANINSRNFRYRPKEPYTIEVIDRRPGFYGALRKREIVFHQTPIVLMGIMLDKVRSGTKDTKTQRKIDLMEFKYNDLIKNCPSYCLKEVHNLFIKSHENELSRYKIPWYMPTWIGGLGLTGYKRPSDLDLRKAQAILYNWKNVRPKMHGSKREWQMWTMAEDEMVKEGIATFDSYIDDQGHKDYNHVTASKALDILFRERTTTENIYIKEKIEKNRGMKMILRHNEKVWSLKGQEGKLPPPIDFELLKRLKKYRTLRRPDPRVEREYLKSLRREQQRSDRSELFDLLTTSLD